MWTRGPDFLHTRSGPRSLKVAVSSGWCRTLTSLWEVSHWCSRGPHPLPTLDHRVPGGFQRQAVGQEPGLQTGGSCLALASC